MTEHDISVAVSGVARQEPLENSGCFMMTENVSRLMAIWLFERDYEALLLEVSYDGASKEFVLISRNANGGERTERFRGTAALQSRLLALKEALVAGEWRHVDAPPALNDAWLFSSVN
jgi:hypothetical protein